MKASQPIRWWLFVAMGLISVAAPAQATLQNECVRQVIPDEIDVDEKGIPTTLVFGTAVDFAGRTYPIERVHVEFVREDLQGHRDTAIFHYAGIWQMKYSDTASGKWARMLAPKDMWSDAPAVRDMRTGCFWGQVDVSAGDKKVIIHGVIRRIGTGPNIGEWYHEALVNPKKLEIPTQSANGGAFQVIPDPWSRLYLIKGQVKNKQHLSIFMADDQGQLVGVIEEGYCSGKYRKVINYGNTLVGGYTLHVRIGDEEQVLPIPKY